MVNNSQTIDIVRLYQKDHIENSQNANFMDAKAFFNKKIKYKGRKQLNAKKHF